MATQQEFVLGQVYDFLCDTVASTAPFNDGSGVIEPPSMNHMRASRIKGQFEAAFIQREQPATTLEVVPPTEDVDTSDA